MSGVCVQGFHRVLLCPRVLVDVSRLDTTVTFFGDSRQVTAAAYNYQCLDTAILSCRVSPGPTAAGGVW